MPLAKVRNQIFFMNSQCILISKIVNLFFLREVGIDHYNFFAEENRQNVEGKKKRTQNFHDKSETFEMMKVSIFEEKCSIQLIFFFQKSKAFNQLVSTANRNLDFQKIILCNF